MDDQLQMDEIIKNKNRKKLVTQNTRLYHELKRLQKQIQVLEQTPSTIKQQDQITLSLKLQIDAQSKEIKKLKQQLQARRHENIKDNVAYIKKEEDELICLKKELEQLLDEKNLVANYHQDKLKKLAGNEPLQRHKDNIQNQWAQTKKQNRQLNLKLVELQREVRKYHNIKESAKMKNQTIINADEEKQVQSEIQRMNDEMKNKEIQWRPNMEVLDNEYFSSRNKLQNSQRKLQELVKQQNVWRRRAAALRDGQELQNDHARISKLVMNPRIEVSQTQDSSSRYHLNSAAINHKKSTILNTNKTDHLIRAQSTPNPPLSAKRMFDLKNINEEIAKKQQKIQKSLPKQSLSNSLNQDPIFKYFDKINSKDKKNIKKQIPISNEVQMNEQKQQSISPKKSYMPARQRHRAKTNALPSLAEQIKKTTEEVKKMNVDFNHQSKKAPNTAKESTKQLKTQNEQVKKPGKTPIIEQKQTRYAINQALSPKGSKLKSKSIPEKQQSIVGSQKNTSKQNIDLSLSKGQKDKIHTVKKRQLSERQKRQLVEDIRFSQLSKQPSYKKSIDRQSRIQIDVPQSSKPSSPNKSVRFALDAPPSPTNKNSSKPTFNITIQDRTQPKSPQSPRSPKSPKKTQLRVQIIQQEQSYEEEDTDNIPKIIKRKRPIQMTQVTMGTSM